MRGRGEELEILAKSSRKGCWEPLAGLEVRPCERTRKKVRAEKAGKVTTAGAGSSQGV